MFNFRLLNKALLDKNLDDKAFRLLYLIANNISNSGDKGLKMYIPFIMEKFGWSDSTARRMLKSLSDNGYISKKTMMGEGEKNHLLIKLSDRNTLSQVTGCSKRPCQNRPKHPVTGERLNNTEEYNNMIKEVPGGPGDTWSGEKTKSKNDIVNEYKDKVNDKIRHLKSIKDRMVFDEVLSSVRKLFTWADENKSLFSESQYNSFVTGYRSSVEKIVNGKEKYFKGTRPSDDDTISDEPAEKTYDSQPSVKSEPQSDSSEKHLSWEEWLAWANKTLQNCPDYGAFDRQLERHINKVYGCSEWYSELKGEVSVRMSRIYNSLSRMADKLFNSSGNQPAKRPYENEPFNSIVTEAFQ